MITQKSPFADCKAVLMKEPYVHTYRGEKYDWWHFFYECEGTGQRYTTSEIDNAGVLPVFNRWRKRHSVPLVDEIKALRHHYGLSAVKMSMVAGFGVNQWSCYEEGEVPTLSMARVLEALRKKENFLVFLDMALPELGPRNYYAILSKVTSLSEFEYHGDGGEAELKAFCDCLLREALPVNGE